MIKVLDLGIPKFSFCKLQIKYHVVMSLDYNVHVSSFPNMCSIKIQLEVTWIDLNKCGHAPIRMPIVLKLTF